MRAALPRLRDHMDAVYAGMDAAGLTLLALDFDGTLADIVPRPEDARLTEARRALLRDLHAAPGVAVAVISGRAVDDVRARVGLDDLHYAGEHGLEIAGPGYRRLPPEAEAFRQTAAALRETLSRNAGAVPGVILEPKANSLSVHYRLAPRHRRAAVLRWVRRAIAPLESSGRARVVKGKEVVNVLPPVAWHKGTALAWLMANPPAESTGRGGVFPVYLGDDVTDEDAFAVAHDGGIAARVGRPTRATAAAYALADTAEVEAVLRDILAHAAARRPA